MKHLKTFKKINESYFQDLTPYAYGRPDDCLNIGWIGKEIPEIGDVSDEFIKKLEEVELSDEFTAERHKGFHRCEICGKIMGSSVKKISGNGKCYKFPSQVSHYVKDHNYKPPQEFIEAIMNLKIKESSVDHNTYNPHGFRSMRKRFK